ncbi:MAG: hypothetical protein LBR17_06300 [Bacteroidales bacterium]|jgi:hypothetical protein|nr:hypothetical protein [Bacteroidales bacterium]
MEIIKTRKKHNQIMMFNNAAIFVVSYWFVFYFYQLLTLIPAFALRISAIFYTGKIDFDTLTSASSADIWHDADNIFAIFGTAPLGIVFLVLFNVLILSGIKNMSRTLKILCFWNILNGILRFGGNFIFGHIFSLWSSNLVTDFLEISFPSRAAQLMCIFVMLFIIFIAIRYSCKAVIHLFNPLMGGVKEKILYMVMYPALIGLAYLTLFFSVSGFNQNEFGMAVLSAVFIFYFYWSTARKYRHVAEKRQINPIELNRKLIICVLALSLVKFIDIKGIAIYGTSYREQIIEGFLIIFFSSVFLLIVFGILYYLYKRRKRRKQLLLEAKEIFETNNADIDYEFWGIKTHDMDKYKGKL